MAAWEIQGILLKPTYSELSKPLRIAGGRYRGLFIEHFHVSSIYEVSQRIGLDIADLFLLGFVRGSHDRLS